MKNVKILILGMLLMSVVLVLAGENHQAEFEEGKKLVESKVSCNSLNDEQLEAIGEYYMEQMHAGEAHEKMHEMMGIEEGTTYHEQFHINLAKMMYCGEMRNMKGGMMNMMGGISGGMMNGMMAGMNGFSGWSGMSEGMMGNGYYGNSNGFFVLLSSLTYITFIVLVMAAVYWLIKTANKK